MRGRIVARLGWALCALAIVGSVGTLLLAPRNGGIGRLTNNQFLLADMALAIAFGIVGALVAARQPGNRIAWAFLAIAVGFAVSAFAIEYAYHALIAAPGTLPGGVAAAWIGPWLNDISFFAIPLIPLLFPAGRLPGRRWRPLAWALVAVLALVIVDRAFTPGPLHGGGTGNVPVENPLGVAALAGIKEVAEPLILSSFLVILLTSLAAVAMRGRRAQGAERQQCKWFAYGVVGILIAPILEVLFPPLVWVISATGATFLAVALGIAILRHRLFDIDVLINRTLVYGLLTATLAAVYFGGVALVGAGARAVTGEQGQNQLAIVASTLAVATLFQPLRRRLQATIDRRFYRRKYDAARVIATFGTRLRDETDLAALDADLVTTVQETMQPTHVSLWLRPTVQDRR